MHARRRHGSREAEIEAHPPEGPQKALGRPLGSARNTLLLDDSPYKAAMNPEHCAIHPKEYKLEDKRVEGEVKDKKKTDDDVLGPGGALREYLARLAKEADFVDAFVESSPWRSCGEEAPASSDEVMRKARRGTPSPPPKPPRASRGETRTRSTCRKRRRGRRRRAEKGTTPPRKTPPRWRPSRRTPRRGDQRRT